LFITLSLPVSHFLAPLLEKMNHVAFANEDNPVLKEASSMVLLKHLREYGMAAKESQPGHAKLRRASVMIIISQDLKILMTKRSLKLKSHPGEVCFPGGKQDEEDGGDDVVTALRETKEEVGLDLLNISKDAMLICRLPTLESLNHLCVTPIVGFVDVSSEYLSSKFKINTDEVDKAFWTPLKYFWEEPPVEQFDIEWSGGHFVFRKYLFQHTEKQSFSITGLTAHVAHETASIAYNQGGDV